MKRIGLFLEVSNLYHTLNKRYSKKLNYKRYYDFVSDLGDIQQAIAYGAQVKSEATGFMICLREAGFLPKYKEPKEFHDGTKKANWDVGMVIDIIQMIDRLDMVVLGSADGDFAPMVTYVQGRGLQVVILACNISHELREVATKCMEIPESLLE